MAENQVHKILELAPGETIADYQVIRELGRGAMAIVYLAQQLNLARPVALKIMSSKLAEKPEFVSRFINEVRTAAALSHANIVQAFDAGVIDSSIYYFAMEYIDGETVLQKIKREGKLEVKEGLRIAIDIAGALNYGWQRQEFTHGDIKPENIMLTSEGVPKLADFGLANVRGHQYKGETMLTPHYAAPELIRGDQEANPLLADIYAFGASLYHILSGTTPYPGDNSREVMNKHLRDPLEPLIHRDPTVPLAVSDFVGQMLAKTPASRPRDWEQVGLGLKQCLLKVEQGSAGSASEVGISPKRLVVSQSRAAEKRSSGKAAPRSRSVLNILIALAVLVLAAIAGVLVYQKHQNNVLRQSLMGLPMDGDYETPPAERVPPADVSVQDDQEPAESETQMVVEQGGAAVDEASSQEETVATAVVDKQKDGNPEEPVEGEAVAETAGVDGKEEVSVDQAEESDEQTVADNPQETSPVVTPDMLDLSAVPTLQALKPSDILEINRIRLVSLLTSLETRNGLNEDGDGQLLHELESWRAYPDGSDFCQEYIEFLKEVTLPAFDECQTRLLLNRGKLVGQKLKSSHKDKSDLTVQNVTDTGVVGNRILGKGEMKITMSWRQLADEGYWPEVLRLGLTAEGGTASDLQSYLAYRLWSKTYNPQIDSEFLQRPELLGEGGKWRDVFALRLENRKAYAALAERLEQIILLAANGANVEAARFVQELRQKFAPSSPRQESLYKSLQKALAPYSLEQQGLALIQQGRKQRESSQERAFCCWLAVKNYYGGNYTEYKMVDKLLEELLPKLNKELWHLREDNASNVFPFLDGCYGYSLPARTWAAAQILLKGEGRESGRKSAEALRQLGRLEAGNWQAARKIDGALQEWNYDGGWAKYSRAYAKILVGWRADNVQPGDWEVFSKLPISRYRFVGKSNPKDKPSQSGLAPTELLTAYLELAHILGGKHLVNSYNKIRNTSTLERAFSESKQINWRLLYLSMASLLDCPDFSQSDAKTVMIRKRDHIIAAIKRNSHDNEEKMTNQMSAIMTVLPDRKGLPRVALGDFPVHCEDAEAWLTLQVSSRLSLNSNNLGRKGNPPQPRNLTGHPDDAQFFFNCCDTYGRGWGPVGGKAIFRGLLLRVNNELEAKQTTAALKLTQDILDLNLPCLAPFYPRLQFLLAGLQELSGQPFSLPDARSRVLACLTANAAEKEVISFADGKPYGALVVNAELTGEYRFWQDWLAVCVGVSPSGQVGEELELSDDSFLVLARSLLEQASRLKAK